MKVNIGCGQQRLLGFINVDGDPWVRPDVVGVPMDLPFEPGSVSEIYAARVLDQLADPVAALRYWRRLLTKDGILWLAVSDARATCEACVGKRVYTGAGMRLREANEVRLDHTFSPYFLELCLQVAGFGELTRVAQAPYSPEDETGQISFRAVNIHPVRRLAQKFWRPRHRQFVLAGSYSEPYARR